MLGFSYFCVTTIHLLLTLKNPLVWRLSMVAVVNGTKDVPEVELRDLEYWRVVVRTHVPQRYSFELEG